KAGIRAAHGAAAEPGVSGYPVANEVAGASRGLLIALPAAGWAVFARVSAGGLARGLVALGRQGRVAQFVVRRRGPQRTPPRPRERSGARYRNVATARLLKSESP